MPIDITNPAEEPSRFLLSASSVAGLPDLGLPEVALAGRSNVGKSSLLGQILQRPKLVRTSRTPGRTRALNLFLFERRLALMDLPGYGYAKLPKSERARLRTMLEGYIAEREPLLGVVLLLDIRKVDLVGKNRRQHPVRQIERALGVPDGAAVLCSSETGDGRAELVARLAELAGA